MYGLLEVEKEKKDIDMKLIKKMRHSLWMYY